MNNLLSESRAHGANSVFNWKSTMSSSSITFLKKHLKILENAENWSKGSRKSMNLPLEALAACYCGRICSNWKLKYLFRKFRGNSRKYSWNAWNSKRFKNLWNSNPAPNELLNSLRLAREFQKKGRNAKVLFWETNLNKISFEFDLRATVGNFVILFQHIFKVFFS